MMMTLPKYKWQQQQQQPSLQLQLRCVKITKTACHTPQSDNKFMPAFHLSHRSSSNSSSSSTSTSTPCLIVCLRLQNVAYTRAIRPSNACCVYPDLINVCGVVLCVLQSKSKSKRKNYLENVLCSLYCAVLLLQLVCCERHRR